MPSGLDAILFDFDFTIADSSAGIVECAQFALARLGHEPSDEGAIRGCIGLPLPEMYARLTGERGRAGSFFDEFMARADEVMESLTVLYPDAILAVAAAREAGVRTGIVSTKARRRITGVLGATGNSGLFDIVLGIEDVPAPKPDPAGILRAVAELKTSPGRVVYLGDHAVDAEAAARAGVRFCGVLTGETPRADLERLGGRCCADVAEAIAGLDLARPPID